MPSMCAPIFDEAVRHVTHLGLACGVLDHGLALGEGRCHQHVVRCADGHLRENDAGALEAASGPWRTT